MRNILSANLTRLALVLSILVLGFAVPQLAGAQATLENPAPNSFQSGIGIVSGWKCTGGNLTFTIDNGPPAQLAYGTSRLDTAGTCKDDGNNGFAYLINWNLAGGGQHTLRAFDNGVQFSSVTFIVVSTGAEFLTGLSGFAIAPQFPIPTADTVLVWQESQQNFVIFGSQPHVSGGGGGQICVERHITNVFNFGQSIQLDDGSIWAVDFLDKINVQLWFSFENVLLCALKTDLLGHRTIINVDRTFDNIAHVS